MERSGREQARSRVPKPNPGDPDSLSSAARHSSPRLRRAAGAQPPCPPAPQAVYPFIRPAVRRPDLPYLTICLASHLGPWERRPPESSSSRAAFSPHPTRAARPAKRCVLTGCAPDFAALCLKLKAGAEQPGGGLWEPAASAGKSRGFSVPGRGTGGAAHPLRCLLRSATCADRTWRWHQGTRGAQAPSVDVKPRRREEGGRTRGAPVDPGLSSAIPASLQAKEGWAGMLVL